MCGRYTLKAPREAIAEAFDLAEVPQLLPRYNIAPTQPVPVFPKRQLTTGFALLDAVLSESPSFLPERRGRFHRALSVKFTAGGRDFPGSIASATVWLFFAGRAHLVLDGDSSLDQAADEVVRSSTPGTPTSRTPLADCDAKNDSRSARTITAVPEGWVECLVRFETIEARANRPGREPTHGQAA